MTHPANIAEARELLAPFVGVRLEHQRNADSYVIPRADFVDIYAPGVAFVDADVRGLTNEGVEVCRLGGFGELVRWDAIQEIRVRADHRLDVVLYMDSEPSMFPVVRRIAA